MTQKENKKYTSYKTQCFLRTILKFIQNRDTHLYSSVCFNDGKIYSIFISNNYKCYHLYKDEIIYEPDTSDIDNLNRQELEYNDTNCKIVIQDLIAWDKALEQERKNETTN